MPRGRRRFLRQGFPDVFEFPLPELALDVQPNTSPHLGCRPADTVVLASGKRSLFPMAEHEIIYLRVDFPARAKQQK